MIIIHVKILKAHEFNMQMYYKTFQHYKVKNVCFVTMGHFFLTLLCYISNNPAMGLK